MNLHPKMVSPAEPVDLPASSSSKKQIKEDPSFAAWLENLLIPPSPIATEKNADKNEAKASEGSDPFCNIPAMMRINFCCAETVDTTKAADDQSHSTISEENNQEENEATEQKPSTAPSPPQTWEAILENWSTSLCSKPFVGDGMPPTIDIDIATPINGGSSAATAVTTAATDEKTRIQPETDDKEADIALMSLMIDEDAGSVGKVEPTPNFECNGQDLEPVVNKAIVIYYSSSGSTDGDELQTDPPKEDSTSPEPSNTIVHVVLDSEDDTIMQDGVRFESAGARLPNSTAEMTAVDASNPVRFHNLATGSFCEISVDGEDTPAIHDREFLEKNASTDLPLVEEEDEANSEEALALVAETIDFVEPEAVTEAVTEDPASSEMKEEEMKEKIETAPQADVQAMATEDMAQEKEQNEDSMKEKVVEAVEGGQDNEEEEISLREDDEANAEDIVPAALNDVAELEVVPVESEIMLQSEPNFELEKTESTVKMVSLFVGVFNSEQDSGYH